MTERQESAQPTPLPMIAIDGPAASGKSTVARLVAQKLGIEAFDTGLLYRAVARCALDRGLAPGDVDGLVECANGIEVATTADLTENDGGFAGYSGLRAPAIDEVVSQVAAHPEVRQALFQKQRQIAQLGQVVMVGRDITSVVAPDATVRVYLDASPEERARRRTLDLAEAGEVADLAEVLAEIHRRDLKDSSREHAPLQLSDGVIHINTDGSTAEEIATSIASLWRERNPPGDQPLKQDPPKLSPPVPGSLLDRPEGVDWTYGSTNSYRRRFILTTVGTALRLATNVFAEGVENVPREGPLLFVSNHLHNADPALEYYVFPRPLHFMGKQELFQYPVVRQIAELSGGFPVDRGKVDREALKNVDERLKQGITVGIYPEGGRSPTGALIEAKAGAGLVALKNGAPLIPAAITGSERLPFNGNKGQAQAKSAPRDPGHEGVRVRFGQPFSIPREWDGRKINAAEATEIIMLEIARLLPPDYQGYYRDILASETERRIVPYPSGSASSPAGTVPSTSSP